MNNLQDLKAIRFIPNSKVSHDFAGTNINTFSYRELIERNIPAIGIPCKENGLIVIDVDIPGDKHKYDGREFWTNFCVEYGMPETYTVQTASGGYHFYYSLPPSLNLETFRPPGGLSLGVDVKYRGWVGAPPTAGYTILKGNISTISEAPASLLAFMTTTHTTPTTFENPAGGLAFTAHKPFTDIQLLELRSKITWLQTNGSLDRSEWRDGLFALKAGIDDPVVLDEFIDMWTLNQNYVEGDELEARSIVESADKYGPIGPGTLFAILKAVANREGASALDSPYTREEILNKSRVKYSFTKEGLIKVETSESNASSLVGAMFPVEELYHDSRSDLYIYKGKNYSDTDLVNILIPKIQSPYEGLGLEKFRRTQIASGLEVLLAERRVDPHRKYLETLVWDGKPRIETFFQHYAGVDDTAYYRKVSKNLWVALAARGIRPGCKFDTVVVLEGVEGARKSSLVKAIGGEYTFAPSRRDAFENLDELRKMHQSVVVELPELMGLAGENSEKVKAFLATSCDHIRDLYARKAIKKERGFVIIGTTNDDKYITKAMGLRRFWPVKIPAGAGAIKVDEVIEDRDQLFAEAIAHYKDGYRYYEMDQEELSRVASSKVITDPLTAALDDMIINESVVDIVGVYKRLEAGGYISRGFTPVIRNRIEAALKGSGFIRHAEGGIEQWRRLSPVESNLFYGMSLEGLV